MKSDISNVSIYHLWTNQAMDASGDVIATLTSINGQPVPANRSSVFPEGTYHLVYSAVDGNNNEAECDLTVNVVGE